MTIVEALRRLADELSTEIPDLLTTPLTFGLVWLDLCRLAGEEPPADVAALAEAAIVAVAAERFRGKHGRWPESADQLTPWPLPRVPVDPHTDEPLVWSRSDDMLVIYSPGPDLVDDGGALEQDPKSSPGEASSPRRDTPYWQGKDIGFRLYDVPLRRRSPRPEDELPPRSTSSP